MGRGVVLSHMDVRFEYKYVRQYQKPHGVVDLDNNSVIACFAEQEDAEGYVALRQMEHEQSCCKTSTMTAGCAHAQNCVNYKVLA